MTVPTGDAVAELEVMKSRFIACAGPLDDPESIRVSVEATRAGHPGCSHVVWAFVFGGSGERFGSSDDREPKGTAGRPVLEVLRGSEITNTLIRVVRYFGGTKLGTGGLVKAYGEAAKRVLDRLPVEPLVRRRALSVTIDYRFYDRFTRLLREYDAVVDRQRFETDVSVQFRIDEAKFDSFESAAGDLSGGTVRFGHEPM